MGTEQGVILPVAYFPPLSYFTHFLSGKEILIETGETFPKQTYRNRCEIATSSGKQLLIVPIHKPHGNHTRTHEVLISPHGSWQIKHWRALESAYSSSPYFLYYSDQIQGTLQASYRSLEDLNLAILNRLLDIFQTGSSFSVSHDYKKETGMLKDLREAFSKRKYIPGKVVPYHQVFRDKVGFLPDLSILDLLFNLGPDSIPYLHNYPEISE